MKEVAHGMIDTTVMSQLGAACASKRDNRPGRLMSYLTTPSTVRFRSDWLRPGDDTDIYQGRDPAPCRRLSQLPAGLRKGKAGRHGQLSADWTLTTISAGDATHRSHLTRLLVISKYAWNMDSGRSAAGSLR